MLQKSLSRRYKIVILLLLILSIILFFPFRTAVVFYKQNTNHVEAYLPIKEGNSFQILFTHSIHLTDVVEIYDILQDGSIKQTEIVFEEYGIGMPSNASDGGKLVIEDGKIHIKEMDRTFPFINLRNGKVVPRHRLVWGKGPEHMVWFKDYFAPGARLTIKMDKLSLWQLLKGVKIHE